METQYTWDEDKARLNLRKHGVSFASAKEVFEDPNQVVAENYFTGGEQRYQIIGMTHKSVLPPVVFVDRDSPDIEIIHIVSARKAESLEEEAYEKQIS